MFNNNVWEAMVQMVFPHISHFYFFILFLAKSDQTINVLPYNMAEKQLMLEIFPSVSFFTLSLFALPWIPSNSFKQQLIC